MRRSLEELITKYRRSVFAAAYNICRSAEDANDIVQETFISYFTSDKDFTDENHLRAWLIRVAVNKAKNFLRSSWNKNVSLNEEVAGEYVSEPDGDMLREIFRLPEKYRIVIHLFYYEGFSVKEIAGMLGISEGSTKMRLSRGRSMLKEKLKEEQP